MAHPLRFSKMHGAGNDFVLIDLRAAQGCANAAGAEPAPDSIRGRAGAATAMAPDRETLRALADRHRGIGCDQIIGIVHSPRGDCIAGYKVWNADGSSAQQCGNGARCVAAWLLRAAQGYANAAGAEPAPDSIRGCAGAAADDAQGSKFRLDSPAGVVEVEAREDGSFAFDLGVPEFAPARIPLRGFDQAPEYTLAIDGERVHFGAVSMGNPHALIVVEAIANAPVARIGSAMQSQHAFPDSVNVGFAQILSPGAIRLRVYERGVGETLACGSGACAAVAILVRQARVGRNVQVDLPGGMLEISWPDDLAPVRMRGPAAFVFEGEWLP